MKQTAVEWLVEQIIKEKGLVDLDIQAAKEMEKEQIIEAFDKGKNMNRFSEALDFADETSGIDYYDIIYK